MDNKILYIIIGVACLAVIVLAIVFMRISAHKKSKKLQENLDKYKKENATKPVEDTVTLSQDQEWQAVSENEIFGDTPKANEKEQEEDQKIDESKIFEEFEDMPRRSFREPPHPFREPPRPSREPRPRHNEMQERLNRDREFEEFLNEHAFSRKVMDKSLLEKIKKLPPEIKSVILGNIFNKFDDDK